MTLLAEIWNMLTPWQRRGILAMQAVSLVMAYEGLLKSSAVFRRMAGVG
jgi:hypothetical protein